MKASILDLRYKMKDVLQALSKNETITIIYHGKEKGVIRPVRKSRLTSVSKHPFFGMNSLKPNISPNLNELRKPRYS